MTRYPDGRMRRFKFCGVGRMFMQMCFAPTVSADAQALQVKPCLPT